MEYLDSNLITFIIKLLLLLVSPQTMFSQSIQYVSGEVPITKKEESKLNIMEYGGPSVMIIGALMMLLSYVNN